MQYRRTSRTRPAVVGAVGAVLVLGLAACSGDDKEPEKPSGAKSSTTARPSVDPGKVSPTDLPKVPTLGQAKGAVSDASFGACATKAGPTKVEGTITSTAKQARDYVVTVSWVNDTFDVLGRGVQVVRDVAPGAGQDFTVSATVPKGATSCTFQVLRGVAK